MTIFAIFAETAQFDKYFHTLKRKDTERHNYPVLQSATPHKNTDIFTISLCRFCCVGNGTEIKTMPTYVTSIIIYADCNSFQGPCRYYILPCSLWTFHNKTVILHNRNTQAAPSSVNYLFLSQNTSVRMLILVEVGGWGEGGGGSFAPLPKRTLLSCVHLTPLMQTPLATRLIRCFQ